MLCDVAVFLLFGLEEGRGSVSGLPGVMQVSGALVHHLAVGWVVQEKEVMHECVVCHAK